MPADATLFGVAVALEISVTGNVSAEHTNFQNADAFP